MRRELGDWGGNSQGENVANQLENEVGRYAVIT